MTGDAEARRASAAAPRSPACPALEMSGAGLEEAFLTLTSGDAGSSRHRETERWPAREVDDERNDRSRRRGRRWSPARTYALEAKYEFLKLLRMPGYAIPSIAFPAMFYLLFGVMFGRGDGRRRCRWRPTSSRRTARSA